MALGLSRRPPLDEPPVNRTQALHRLATTHLRDRRGAIGFDVVDGARSRHRCAIRYSSEANRMRGAVQMQITTIGLDIAKNVFQVHGIDANETVVVGRLPA